MEVTGASQQPYVNVAAQPVERVNEAPQTGGAEEKTRTVAAKQSAPPPQDRVDLSAPAREVDRTKKVVAQQEGFRTEKVEQLKEAVQSGTYQVNPENVAEKMMGEIW